MPKKMTFNNRDIYFSNSILIEITKQCNYACKHCFTGAGQSLMNEMNTEQVIDVVNDLISNGFKYITLSGGEPTIRSDLIKILMNINKNEETVIGLFTNGYGINDENIIILKKYIDQFIISIDGDRISHEYLRGFGTFDDTIRMLELFKKNNIIFSIQMVVSDFNWDDIDKVVSIGVNYGASGLKFSHIGPQGRAQINKIFLTSFDRQNELLNKVEDLKKTMQIPVSHNFVLKDKLINKKEDFFVIFIHITSDGYVLPYYGLSNLAIGNYKDGKFIDIISKAISSSNFNGFYRLLQQTYDRCKELEQKIIPFEEVLIENEKGYPL